ncbi:MAG: helix-turn-helix transcriptional regulator [Bacteroidia bacterium]|nr:helix-turn-helix transcriptional regulator [Bacteroidia bacterium]
MLEEEEKFIRQFGQRIRALRKQLDISQEELALRSEMSINQIGRIERGEINTSLLVLRKLAKALEVPENKLLTDLGEK